MKRMLCVLVAVTIILVTAPVSFAYQTENSESSANVRLNRQLEVVQTIKDQARTGTISSQTVATAIELNVVEQSYEKDLIVLTVREPIPYAVSVDGTVSSYSVTALLVARKIDNNFDVVLEAGIDYDEDTNGRHRITRYYSKIHDAVSVTCNRLDLFAQQWGDAFHSNGARAGIMRENHNFFEQWPAINVEYSRSPNFQYYYGTDYAAVIGVDAKLTYTRGTRELSYTVEVRVGTPGIWV